MGQSNITSVLENQLFLLRTFYCQFVYFIVLCLWNALHLYNFDHKSDLMEKLNYLEFRDQIVRKYIRKDPALHSSHSSSTSISTPSTSRQQQSKGHYPQKLSKRLRCRYCSFRSKRTTTFFPLVIIAMIQKGNQLDSAHK